MKNAEFISRNDYVIRVYLNHRIRQTSGELNCQPTRQSTTTSGIRDGNRLPVTGLQEQVANRRDP
jgi:hypothetical protein